MIAEITLTLQDFILKFHFSAKKTNAISCTFLIFDKIRYNDAIFDCAMNP